MESQKPINLDECPPQPRSTLRDKALAEFKRRRGLYLVLAAIVVGMTVYLAAREPAGDLFEAKLDSQENRDRRFVGTGKVTAYYNPNSVGSVTSATGYLDQLQSGSSSRGSAREMVVMLESSDGKANWVYFHPQDHKSTIEIGDKIRVKTRGRVITSFENANK